jgi:hypothetical protein
MKARLLVAILVFVALLFSVLTLSGINKTSELEGKGSKARRD